MVLPLVVSALVLSAVPAPAKPSPFAVLLEQGAEWVYVPYSEDEKGTRADLPSPGEVRLRVALVQTVGETTLVGLAPFVDGVDADQLKADLDLDLPMPPSPFVVALTRNGLRGTGLSLDEAKSATNSTLTAALDTFGDALVFPTSFKKGWSHRWKYEDPQQLYQATGSMSRVTETVDGHDVEAWAVRWKGKACFAGECSPYAGTQVFAPDVGLVRICRVTLMDAAAMHCLRMVSKANGPARAATGTAPSLGDVWRTLQASRPAISACMHLDSSVSVLGFTVEPDGHLSNVKEKNQSGKDAACTVAAVSSVRFPPFTGAPRVVDRISFAK